MYTEILIGVLIGIALGICFPKSTVYLNETDNLEDRIFVDQRGYCYQYTKKYI